MRKYKERRLYFYTCSKCSKTNRCSFKRSKAKNAVCRTCKGLAVNKDQINMFPEQKVTVEYLINRGFVERDATYIMTKPELVLRYQNELDLELKGGNNGDTN